MFYNCFCYRRIKMVYFLIRGTFLYVALCFLFSPLLAYHRLFSSRRGFSFFFFFCIRGRLGVFLESMTTQNALVDWKDPWSFYFSYSRTGLGDWDGGKHSCLLLLRSGMFTGPLIDRLAIFYFFFFWPILLW
ncbi:hypothetical protein BR93DRAFT_275702 [Coniochaeta sp. PMI_546]|nr:hypothetical protein BR93DRAFT_275702 [Coniochaeta sp. PMI_546]